MQCDWWTGDSGKLTCQTMRRQVDDHLDSPVLRGTRVELFLVSQVEVLCLKKDSLFFQDFNETAPGIGCLVLELHQNNVKKKKNKTSPHM